MRILSKDNLSKLCGELREQRDEAIRLLKAYIPISQPKDTKPKELRKFDSEIQSLMIAKKFTDMKTSNGGTL